MKRIILILFLGSSLLVAEESAQEYAKQQMQEFKQYKANLEKEFQAYQTAQMKEFKEYKKSLSKYWDDPKMSSQKNWLLYTDDKKTRSDVDFKNEEITIETVATSKKKAEQNLQIALAKAVTLNTKTIQQIDPLEKKLAKIKKPALMVTQKIKARPVLSIVVFKKPPTKQSVQNYINRYITPKNIKTKKSDKVADARVYKVTIKLPKNTTIRLSKQYLNEVRKEANRQALPLALIFAIMHSESSFNPRARSYVPAYGLMQIVPKTAGVDAYQYLYDERRLVSSSYLYNSNNNIQMGAAYLHILYYRYLRKVKNPTSRLYCTIAAYNTGAGNIAYAFTKKYNMNNAAPIINRMTPEEIYNKLENDLRFDEAKHYLVKVSKRMDTYSKIYGN